MPDDDLDRQNRAEIQEGKRVVFAIMATVETHTAEIARNASDIGKIDERVRVLADSAGANASRDADQDRRMQDLETRQTRSDGQIGDLSLVVTEAVVAAKTLTGAFVDLRGQIDQLRAADSDPLDEPSGGYDAWTKQWREAATPTNAVLLIVVVTTIGAMVRGEINQAEATAQIQAAAQSAIVAPPPEAPEP